MENLLKTLSDPWVLFGFLAQFIFFLRFVVQWIASEKNKKVVIPMSFWYLSLVGSIMILIYSIKRQDIVFITASILNTLIYIRNIYLSKKDAQS
jgi:lipid-A-disaccharide synthase-like uncharacterized protein